MLPYMPSMIMAALSKQGQNPIADILGEYLAGGSARSGQGAVVKPQGSAGSGANDAFKELSDIFKGQLGEPSGAGQTASPLQQSGNQQFSGASVPGASADIFKDIFNSEGDRSPFEDILNDMLGGRR